MKKRFGILLTLIILILLVYVLKDLNPNEILSLLKQSSPIYLALAFLSVSISFLFWNLRFQNTIRGFVRETNFFFLLKVLMAGILVNTITPGTGIGGEPVRAHYLSKKYKKPKTKFLGFILADKAFNWMIFLIFLIISIFLALPLINIPVKTKIAAEAILIILGIILVIIIFITLKRPNFNSSWFYTKLYKIKSINRKFLTPEEFQAYLKKRISNFKKTFLSSISSKNKLAVGLFLSLLVWVFLYLSSYFLFLAFNSKINFISIIIVVTFGYFIGDISPVPGGIGLKESTMFLLYTAMAVSGELAAIVALLSRIIYYFHALLIGGISLISLRWQKK